MGKCYDDALAFVTSEKELIEDATDMIREDLRRARRNYECKFDDPIDKGTGKRKIFYPLTAQEVDAVAPRFESDPESIVIKSNEPGHRRKSMIWEELLKTQFSLMEWKARIKELMVPFVNDGTIVIEMFWNEEKKRVDFKHHDLKNVYIFPQEPSLEAASAFAVREKVVYADFMNSDLYENKDEVSGSEEVSDNKNYRTRGTLQYEIGKFQFQTELSSVELYRRYGLFPKYFLTDKEKDEESGELVEGCITIANIGSNAVCVGIEETDARKNFVEAWYIKRPYSWYGKGIGVALRDYQFLLNKIVNRRDDNEDVLHRGMFVKRRGMNIDARQKITGSGIWIEADDINNVRQLQTIDITQGSYTGETNILNSVQRLNGTYSIALGGGSAQSASEAALKDRNAGTRLSDPQAYLNRMFKKAIQVAMEMTSENLPKNYVVKYTGRDEELAAFDDFKLKEVNAARSDEGLPPISDMEFKATMQKQFGKERLFKIPSMNFLKGDFFPDIDLDASMIKNRQGVMQNLLDSFKFGAQIPQVAQTIDMADLFEQFLGIVGVKVKRVEQPMQPMGMMPQSGGVEGQAPNPMQDAVKEMLTQAGAPRADQNIA